MSYIIFEEKGKLEMVSNSSSPVFNPLPKSLVMLNTVSTYAEVQQFYSSMKLIPQHQVNQQLPYQCTRYKCAEESKVQNALRSGYSLEEAYTFGAYGPMMIK